MVQVLHELTVNSGGNPIKIFSEFSPSVHSCSLPSTTTLTERQKNCGSGATSWRSSAPNNGAARQRSAARLRSSPAASTWQVHARLHARKNHQRANRFYSQRLLLRVELEVRAAGRSPIPEVQLEFCSGSWNSSSRRKSGVRGATSRRKAAAAAQSQVSLSSSSSSSSSAGSPLAPVALVPLLLLVFPRKFSTPCCRDASCALRPRASPRQALASL